jgi:uncharacterized membrane protein YwzB
VLKQLKRLVILIAIILSLLVANRFYEDYRFQQNWPRVMEQLGER